jgi:acyl-coenzyme A thioesterase PaaI-like protein
MTFLEKIKLAKPVMVHQTKRSFVSGKLINDFIDALYYFNEENHQFYTMVTFGEMAQGPPNHVHGGAIAAIIDETMGAAAWMNRLHSMTAKLKINYFSAIPLNKQIYIETFIQNIEGKKVTLVSRIFDDTDKLYVQAESLFIKQGKEKFQQMGDMPDELFTYGVEYKPND